MRETPNPVQTSETAHLEASLARVEQSKRQGLSPAELRWRTKNYAKLVPNDGDIALKKVRSRIGKACKLIVMVPTPGTAREVTTQALNSYKSSEKDDRTYLVDLGTLKLSTSDGMHPTAAGHHAIAEKALPAFDAILKGN